MKLWDSLTTCFILLSAVHVSPLTWMCASESPPDSPPVQTSGSVTAAANTLDGKTDDQEATLAEEQYSIKEVLPEHFENVVDFIKETISRIRRSSSSVPFASASTFKMNVDPRTRPKRERKKVASQRGKGGGAKREEKGKKGKRKEITSSSERGQGCMLKQIHLNVSDLGLGYSSDEEMIFRYCSGPCRKSETNYDKILNNLTQSRKIFSKDMPPHACCRPIVFDDDLSFLDNNLIYHTVRKYSARKCGCV